MHKYDATLKWVEHCWRSRSGQPGSVCAFVCLTFSTLRQQLRNVTVKYLRAFTVSGRQNRRAKIAEEGSAAGNQREFPGIYLLGLLKRNDVGRTELSLVTGSERLLWGSIESAKDKMTPDLSWCLFHTSEDICIALLTFLCCWSSADSWPVLIISGGHYK